MTDKDVFEPLKKAFLIGLGATAMTVEKIQELANDMVERGEMTQKDAKSFSEDLKTRAMKEKDQLESRIKETVDSYMKNAIKSLGLVTKEDLDNLKAEMKNGSTPKTASTTKKK